MFSVAICTAPSDFCIDFDSLQLFASVLWWFVARYDPMGDFRLLHHLLSQRRKDCGTFQPHPSTAILQLLVLAVQSSSLSYCLQVPLSRSQPTSLDDRCFATCSSMKSLYQWRYCGIDAPLLFRSSPCSVFDDFRC